MAERTGVLWARAHRRAVGGHSPVSAGRPHARLRRFDARLILSWIGKNLEGCTDPRAHGKGLTANRSGEWRYRIGSYRALCVIEDDRLIIEVFSVGHRRNTQS
mgnify:FL=1